MTSGHLLFALDESFIEYHKFVSSCVLNSLSSEVANLVGITRRREFMG